MYCRRASHGGRDEELWPPLVFSMTAILMDERGFAGEG